MKMVEELEHLSWEERLRATTVQPGEEDAQGGHIDAEGNLQRGWSQASLVRFYPLIIS